jgi:hypothetical protein
MDLSPIFLASAVAALASYYFSPLLGLELYLDGVVKAVVFFAIYLGWSLFFKPEAYTYSLSVLSVLKSKRSKLNVK